MKRFLKWLAFRILRGETILVISPNVELAFDKMVQAEEQMRYISEVWQRRDLGPHDRRLADAAREGQIHEVCDARRAFAAKMTYEMREMMSALCE